MTIYKKSLSTKIINFENINLFFKFLKNEKFKSLFTKRDLEIFEDLFDKNNLGFYLLYNNEIIGVWLILKNNIFDCMMLNLSTFFIKKEFRSLYFYFFNRVKFLNANLIFNTSMNKKLIKIHEKYDFRRLDCKEIYFFPKKLNIKHTLFTKIYDYDDSFKYLIEKNLHHLVDKIKKIKQLNIKIIIHKKETSLVIYKIKKIKKIFLFADLLYVSNQKTLSDNILKFYINCFFNHKILFFKTHCFIYNLNKFLFRSEDKTIMYKSPKKFFNPSIILSELIFFNQ